MPLLIGELAAAPVTRIESLGGPKTWSKERREKEREKNADALKKAHDITTVLDVLTHYPIRYIDRTNQAAIRDLQPGDQALVVATVRRSSVRRTQKGRSLVEVVIGDGTADIRCTFFNQPWQAKQLPVDTEAVFFGKVELYRGKRQMTNPVVDLIGDRTGRIIPIYRQSEKHKLTTWQFADWIAEGLRRMGELADPLSPERRKALDLVSRTWALEQIHNPETMAAQGAARKRLAFDELFRLQVALVLRKRAVERESKGFSHVIEGDLVRQFHASLPFALTRAQQRAISEIAADLAGPYPMHRLLQGDVGSGKTVVATTALLMAVQGGHQGALMAPTEVLAEQHDTSLRKLLAGLTVKEEGSLLGERPLTAVLLTGRTPAAERTKLRAALASGAIDILIGTHALLSEGIDFHDLGVVVVDEQHRFGVEQRAALRGKGSDPDLLVMTATPIPRTAAMTLYGDLDMTILDELPPGRTPVKTLWARGPLEEHDAWERVRTEVAAGHQAYVVCPLVEESERVEAKSAEVEFERLRAEVFPELRLGLVHGRVHARDREQVMEQFRAGEIDVLVATTVIEVGIDVPNASVMVIESAERFGIAQLHQLRGRVGRGAAVSWCYLLAAEPKEDDPEPNRERLEAMVRTTDGFELAEVDLDLRGEGTILGVRQKGRTDLKLASLRKDKDLLLVAREVAFDIVDADPFLGDNPVLADEIRRLIEPEEEEFLFKS